MGVNLVGESAWRHPGQDKKSLRLQGGAHHRVEPTGAGHCLGGGELVGGPYGWDLGAMKA